MTASMSCERWPTAFIGGCVDLSVGEPSDPPPPEVVAALSASDAERGYPASLGSIAYREAALGWLARRFGINADGAAVASCVGTKDLWSRCPTICGCEIPAGTLSCTRQLPIRAMPWGAELAGCRAVPVPLDHQWHINLDAVDPGDAARSLCLWMNSPGNPRGPSTIWPRPPNGVATTAFPVFSDECYIEYIWDPRPPAMPRPAS